MSKSDIYYCSNSDFIFKSEVNNLQENGLDPPEISFEEVLIPNGDLTGSDELVGDLFEEHYHLFSDPLSNSNLTDENKEVTEEDVDSTILTRNGIIKILEEDFNLLDSNVVTPCTVVLHNSVNINEISKCDQCKQFINNEREAVNIKQKSSVSKNLGSHKQNSLQKSQKVKPKYNCKLCQENFSNKKDFLKHMNAHTNGFQCDTCKKAFSSKRGVSTHVLTHIKKLYYCCYCNGAFEEEDELYKHFPDHFEEQCFESNESQEGFNDEKLMQSDSNDRNEGIFENQDFMQPEKSQDLMNCYDPEENIVKEDFENQNCLESDKSQGPLNRSDWDKSYTAKGSGVILDLGKYECNYCRKTFRGLQCFCEHLALHLNNVFECEKCPSKFNDFKSWKSHFYSHMEEPVQCEVCYKIFSSKRSLKLHHRTHSDMYPYECSFCYLKFESWSSFMKHQWTYLNFLKTSEDDNNLCNHSSSDAKARPLRCGICHRAFKYESSLVEHMRSANLRIQTLDHIYAKIAAKDSTAA